MKDVELAWKVQGLFFLRTLLRRDAPPGRQIQGAKVRPRHTARAFVLRGGNILHESFHEKLSLSDKATPAAPAPAPPVSSACCWVTVGSCWILPIISWIREALTLQANGKFTSQLGSLIEHHRRKTFQKQLFFLVFGIWNKRPPPGGSSPASKPRAPSEKRCSRDKHWVIHGESMVIPFVSGFL